jgi:hypothetical protein
MCEPSLKFIDIEILTDDCATYPKLQEALNSLTDLEQGSPLIVVKGVMAGRQYNYPDKLTVQLQDDVCDEVHQFIVDFIQAVVCGYPRIRTNIILGDNNQVIQMDFGITSFISRTPLIIELISIGEPTFEQLKK